MAITKIKVSNFKSFDELEVELRPLNVVVGGNASGKSNFLEIFRFLRDMITVGIVNALSLRGGMEYLANFQTPSRPVMIDVTTNEGGIYRLSLNASKEVPGFQILEDSYLSGGRIKNRRVLEGIYSSDFDPGLSKRGSPISEKVDLEPDGSNLAVVLKKLLRNRERRESFLLLLRDLLPFVEDLKVDDSLSILLKESFRGPYIPAAFLSDGTLHLMALVATLYFDTSYLTLLEEPDRNIHPHLIARLASMMADVSAEKQIIATTHNPELVKHTALEDLLLMRRDEHGFSRISRPSESEELKVFLENDLGVEDLYVQNLLDIGHAV